MWTSPPVAIPLRDLKLKRLYLPPAKRPDKRAEAIYLAAWYQIEQQGGEKVPNVAPMSADFSDVGALPLLEDLAIPAYLERRDEVQATQDLRSQTQTRSEIL